MITPNVYRAIVNGKPVLDPPYDRQREVLYYIFKPPYDGAVRRINLCCGWGFGKTQVAIDASQALLDLCPGNDGLFTEPDVSLMGNFLRMWEETVPPEMYKIYRGNTADKRFIRWLRTGSVLYYDHRNFRGSLDQTVKHFQGRNYAFHVDDETSTACSMELLTAIEARIRKPGAPILVRLTTSTPRVGEYAQLLALPDSITIRGKSEDNPYISRDKLAQQRASMSRAQARRDMDGELVALEDQLWDMVDLDQPWPRGNVDDQHPRFNPAHPWYLFCDMGSATGAYIVVQRVDRGCIDGSPRWVIVADFCPQSSANVRRVFHRLRAQFGTPAGVVAGQDVKKQADTDGATPAYFVQKTWGNVHIYIADESVYAKQIQYDVATYLFDEVPFRRMTVARDLVEGKAAIDKDSHRGVVEMIQQDVWQPEESRRAAEYLPKGPKITISHVRDALLMGASMVMRPPQWKGDPGEKSYDDR